jgi:hypothetical protein
MRFGREFSVNAKCAVASLFPGGVRESEALVMIE